MKNKNWLVFANRDKYHHAEALHGLGFINWQEGKNFKMNIGDYVYLYVSNERRVQFKTQVVDIHSERQDDKYWLEPVPHGPTYKLEFRDEYKGKELNEDILHKHKFKGGGSIQHPICKKTLLDYIESIFAKKGYASIISEIVPQEKSRELVRNAISILIRWAKQGITNKTYDDLTKELGYTKYSGIGKQLGYIENVFKRLRELTGDNSIPTLNALVKSKSTGLPSIGFSYVYTSYDEMSENEKKIFIMGLDKKAIEYEYWDWVLSSLGLAPSIIDTTASEAIIRSGKPYGSGGEGENHKKLKEYVYNHPEALGIKDIKEKKMEHILLSGDRLDVYFELNNGSQIAIEIKSSTSPDADVMRGLFQCVKYKTILDAEAKVHGEKTSNSAILVIGGELSSENCEVREVLGVNVISNFYHK